MRAWAIAIAAVAILAAGCSEPPAAPPADAGPVVEGWVVDAARAPVVGANVSLAGAGVSNATDDEGHYVLAGPPGVELLVTVSAEGFLPASQAVSAFAGAAQVLNFTLERVPVAQPYRVVTSFNGFLQCGAVAVVLEDQGRPHEHTGVRCSTLLNDTRNIWHTALPEGASGLVMEAVWEAQTPASQALVLKATADGSAEVLGFHEDISPLRIQFAQAKVEQLRQAGLTAITVAIEAGAGTGEHEHGAAGAFFEQSFTLYLTAFYNGPADPSYSITRNPP